MSSVKKWRKMFFRLVTSVGQRKKVSMRNRASHLRIPRSDVLTTEPQRLHGERGLLRSSYDTRPANCSSVDQQCRKCNACKYRHIYKHCAFDIADPSNIQDVCHMNFNLTHRGVSVAQWLEHQSVESEGLRLDPS